jgi:hypothetical protein
VRPLLLALVLTALPLAAQAPGPFGAWTLASAPDLAKAIDGAVAPLNFMIRPIARSRLTKTNSIFHTVRLERDPAGFAIRFDQREPEHMPADGTAVPWTREDGEKFLISAHLEQDDLVQTYQAEDGQRTNVFHLEPGRRTLTLEVTVSSPRLPAPLRYNVSYGPLP